MFNEMFKGSPKFTYNSDNNIFISVSEFLKDHDMSLTYQVKGMFTYTGEYGETGVIIIDGYNIRVPKYMVDKIKEIRSTPDMVDAINAGFCGLKFRAYEDKKHKGTVRTAVDLCDYAPADVFKPQVIEEKNNSPAEDLEF